MASITDHVSEGLKYPFTDIKKFLGFGALFAVLNVISIAIGIKNIDIFKAVAGEIENSNVSAMSLQISQLPMNDICIVAALAVISFIISLFIMGYQYRTVKFSIDKKHDLPGFNDTVNIFVCGIRYFIVTVAYYIIPAALLILGVVLTANQSGGAYVILLSLILFVIVYFIHIMASNNMIANDSLKKAFEFKQITDNISNLGWGKYVGIVIFTLIVFMIVNIAAGFVLSIVTALFGMAFSHAMTVTVFFEILEGFLITSFTALFYSRVCGSIYRESVK